MIDEVYSIKDQLSKEAGHSVEKLIERMKKEINRSDWHYVSFDPRDAAGQVLKPASK